MKKLFYLLLFSTVTLYLNAITVGYTVKGTATHDARNKRMGNLVTIGATGGTVQSISVYLLNANNNTTAKVKAAIYNADRTSKLGESAEITITANNNGWVTCTFTAKPTIAASTNYWIVCWVNNPSAAVTGYSHTITGKTELVFSSNYGAWPTSLSADVPYSGYEMSIYMDYTTVPTLTTTAASAIAQTTGNRRWQCNGRWRSKYNGTGDMLEHNRQPYNL